MTTSLKAPEGSKVPEPPKTLIEKCAAIMSALGYVPKNGVNSFHGYKYALESDILDAVRGEAAKHGVLIVPSVEKCELGTVGRGFDQKGNPKTERIVTLTVKFTVTDGKDSFTFNAIGEGTDPGDKASYKAMTGATKYALLKLFLIPTGDDPSPQGASDPEKEDGEDKGEAPKSRVEALKAKVAAKAGEPGDSKARIQNVKDRLAGLGKTARAAQFEWVKKALPDFTGEGMSPAEWRVLDGLLKHDEDAKKQLEAAAGVLGAQMQ